MILTRTFLYYCVLTCKYSCHAKYTINCATISIYYIIIKNELNILAAMQHKMFRFIFNIEKYLRISWDLNYMKSNRRLRNHITFIIITCLTNESIDSKHV